MSGSDFDSFRCGWLQPLFSCLMTWVVYIYQFADTLISSNKMDLEHMLFCHRYQSLQTILLFILSTEEKYLKLFRLYTLNLDLQKRLQKVVFLPSKWQKLPFDKLPEWMQSTPECFTLSKRSNYVPESTKRKSYDTNRLQTSNIKFFTPPLVHSIESETFQIETKSDLENHLQ